jgi:predicted transcriptional regulator
LAASLNAILAERKLTQAETARLLGVNQPKVSALKGYKLGGLLGGAANALRYVDAKLRVSVTRTRQRSEVYEG